MYYYLFVLLLITNTVYSQIISIEITRPISTQIDSIQLSREDVYGNSITFSGISPKNTEKFTFKFNANQPTFYSLKIGKEYLSVYLKPNNKYKITFTDFENSKWKIGFGDAINEYLQKQNFLSQNFTYNGKSLVRCEPNVEFPAAMAVFLNEHRILLKKLSDSISISNIDSQLLSNKIMNFYHWRKLSTAIAQYNGKYEQLPNYYLIPEKALNLKDENLYYGNNMFLMMLRMYTNYINSISFSKIVNSEGFKELSQESIISEYQKNGINTIKLLSVDKKIKDYMLYIFMEAQIPAINYSNDTSYLSKQYISDPKHLIILQNKLKSLRNIEVSVFPNLNMDKVDGSKLSFSELKGKVIYIDFWATWCAPCIKEFTSSVKLKNEFKSRDDLVFLYASQDSDKEAWEKFLNTHKELEGIHILLKEEQLQQLNKAIKLKAIPHYVIIDKNGKVAVNFAPNPSNKRIKPELQKVLELKLNN